MSRRHQSKLPKLNRSSNSRKSLFKVQLKQLIEYGSITTTVTKAKVIKRLFDRLSARAASGTLSARRKVAAELSNPKSANKLVDLIVPAMGGRRSGFTTIQKSGIRRGDSTATATLSLVIPMPAAPEKPSKKAKPSTTAKASSPKKIIKKKAK